MHAGDMADAIYYSMVERDLLASDEFVNSGVIDWFRFRDDMCFFLKKGQTFNVLLEKMRRNGKFFELKIEDYSTMEMRYLDVVIRRHNDRVETFPFLKDPRLSRRLSMVSAHPRDIHLAWPRIMLERVVPLTKSADAIYEFSDEVRNRLRNDGCLVPARRRCQVKTSSFSGLILWLPMGHHPWWYRHVKKAIAQLNSDVGVSCLLTMGTKWSCPRVKVAWKNMLPSTNKLLKPTGWRMGSVWKVPSSFG